MLPAAHDFFTFQSVPSQWLKSMAASANGDSMALTVEQIIAETRRWPAEQVNELVDRLTAEANGTDPEVEVAWGREIRRRVAEIESGLVQGIPGEEVLARVRRIVG